MLALELLAQSGRELARIWKAKVIDILDECVHSHEPRRRQRERGNAMTQKPSRTKGTARCGPDEMMSTMASEQLTQPPHIVARGDEQHRKAVLRHRALRY